MSFFFVGHSSINQGLKSKRQGNQMISNFPEARQGWLYPHCRSKLLCGYIHFETVSKISQRHLIQLFIKNYVEFTNAAFFNG